MDFNYKKYSLENLENWMHDAISCSEATPQEIFDVIKGVVEENYYIYKSHAERCYELLALLNNNGKNHLSCDKNDTSEECQKSWTSFWEENYYPEEVKEEVKDDGMRPWGHSDMEYLVANSKKDKVTKWQLPVEADPSGEYFVTFPDDLLEASNLKEGDQIEWIDQGDGSYLLKKVEKPMTYDEMIAAGWQMTADGFWIREENGTK